MYQLLIIAGNLGGDPEMRYLPSGMAVTNFNVATSRRWTDAKTGQATDETTWFKVSVWGKAAETANQYLKKGAKVLVQGRLVPDGSGNPRTFTRRDGTAGASFEMQADTFKFLDGKQEGKTHASDSPPDAGGHSEEEDIPF